MILIVEVKKPLERVADGVLKMKLTEIRKKRGLTQAELAEASNVSYRTIQEYEQRRSDLNKASVMTVYQIAKALNCTVEDLIEL